MRNNLSKQYTSDISIILPAMNDSHLLNRQLIALCEQSLQPLEVIVVDSSSDELIEQACRDFNSNFTLVYLRSGRAYRFDRYILAVLRLFKLRKLSSKLGYGKLYPSESTNFGAMHARGKWLALLDMSTIPTKDWMEQYWSKIKSGADVVFGSTEYSSLPGTQRRIHYSTFGNLPHETNPGTLISKELFLSNRMIEGFRAGVDLEWRERIKSKNIIYLTPRNSFLKYSSLPNSLRKFLWKMFVYQMHSVPLEIQQNTKTAFGLIILLITSLAITRWNYLVGWESNYYLPHITKLSLITFNLFFFMLLITKKLGSGIKSISTPFINSIFTIFLSVSIFLLSYRWNGVVAGWMEGSRFYIPHLTKLVIFLFVSFLLIYRGLYFPLKHGVEKKELFPISFISIGIYGALADLAKIPGFLMGALSYPFLGLKKNEKQ
jgi:glycosyltransferase involved in cell wall biosynthesis